MKKIILIAGILFVLIIGTVIVLLSWNKYDVSSSPFSFRYPIGWSVCEEIYPKQDFYYVHVTKKDTCQDSFNDSILAIGYAGKQENDVDVKEFLLRLEIESEAEEIESIKNGDLPAAPGFFWQYIKYEKSLLSNNKVSIAKVKGITEEGMETYVALYEGNVYNININSTEKWNYFLSRVILKSLFLK